MSLVTQRMKDHAAVLEATMELIPDIEKAGALFKEALASGHKILFCGNGGSAADSQHLAAEIVGRFQKERRPFPAIALTVDTSILTAVGNDYGFDTVFARQVRALGEKGDVLVGISTSGNSQNIMNATVVARASGLKIIGLTGAKGGELASVADIVVKAPETETYMVQELHLPIYHCWCLMLEDKFFGK